MKTLASKGYWELEYRPKPGGVGNVTWMNFSTKSLKLVEMAKSVDLTAPRRRARSVTFDGGVSSPALVANSDTPVSENATSIQQKTPTKTTAGKSFILTAKGGQEKMKETSSSQTKLQKEGGVQSPGWITKTPAAEHLANEFASIHQSRDLPAWDWSSKYTWRWLEEIEHKLAKRNMNDPAAIRRLATGLTIHWEWLRHVMNARYASHETNLHRVSPMALAHQIDKLLNALQVKWAEEDKAAFIGPSQKHASNLGEDW
jgi:hypothetical protein